MSTFADCIIFSRSPSNSRSLFRTESESSETSFLSCRLIIQRGFEKWFQLFIIAKFPATRNVIVHHLLFIPLIFPSLVGQF